MKAECGLMFASRRKANAVIPGLVTGIQPSMIAGASGTLDPGDKRRDDNSEQRAEATMNGPTLGAKFRYS